MLLLDTKRWVGKPPVGTNINWGHPLAQGLAGYWLLAESGGLSAYDSIGRSRGDLSGIIATPFWVTGKNGPCISLDGSDPDNVQITDTGYFNFTDVVSVAALVNPSSINAVNAGVFEKTIGGAANTQYSLRGDASAKVNFQIVSSSTGHAATGTTQMLANKGWFSVAGTYDGANINAFLNGIQEGTTAFSGAIDTGSGVLIIGELGGNLFPWFGFIEYVGVWHRALTASEVLWLHVEPYAMFTPPRRRLWTVSAAAATPIPALIQQSIATGSSRQRIVSF